MWFARNLITVAVFISAQWMAKGQTGKAGLPDYSTIFGDLPIDNPASNSVLAVNENPVEKIRRNLFVKAFASKTSCYIGEPILLTYRLYSSLQSKSTIDKRPGLFGFNVKEIETYDRSPALKKSGNRDYRVFTVIQLQLIPFREGKLVIDSMVLNNTVHYEDQSHKTIAYAATVASNELIIQSRPLPSNGKPAGFSGLVGKFTLAASVDSAVVHAGENNTLHIKITGSGSLAGFLLPAMVWPVNLEHFPGKDQLAEEGAVFPPGQSRIFDIPFVAGKEGECGVGTPVLIHIIDSLL